MIYKEIFNFDVLEKLDDGEIVYCADREMMKCFVINQITVKELLQILATSRKFETRYIFWIESEEE